MTSVRVFGLTLATAASLIACMGRQGGSGSKGEAEQASAVKVDAATDGKGEEAKVPGEGEVVPEVEAAGESEDQGEAEPEQAAPEPVRFWVANDGLRAYDLDGKQVASLAKIGDRARRLDDGRIVVYEEGTRQAQVAVLDAKGKVLRRATLPTGFDPQTCALLEAEAPAADEDEGSYVELMTPQDSHDFGIDAAGHACLSLQDRNDNMASYGLLVAVELASAKTRARVELDLDERCEGKGELPAGVCAKLERGRPWVEGERASEAAPKSWPFGFDETRHAITKRGKAQAVVCVEGADLDDWTACSDLESTSPSGRWLLLSGRWSEGDYIHRDLVLFDRATGKLWQIHEEGEHEGFVEATPETIFGDEAAIVMSVVGESDLGWLPGDRLWVDGQLVIPEQRKVVNVGGTRAWTL